MLKPASKGGNDILSVLCDGKDASGNPIVREVSGGTLQKILIDVKNNNKPEPTRGNITEFLADCGDDVSMLKKCVGHTLTFSHPKKVSYVFRGGPTPRETEGTKVACRPFAEQQIRPSLAVVTGEKHTQLPACPSAQRHMGTA